MPLIVNIDVVVSEFSIFIFVGGGSGSQAEKPGPMWVLLLSFD